MEIVSKSGVHVFSVEIADTQAEREKGLMFVKHLPDGQGMLFDFDSEQDIAMWMKNTYIPLDMIFIRGDGRIARIAENTTPLSTAIIPSAGRCARCWRSPAAPPPGSASRRATAWLFRSLTGAEVCLLARARACIERGPMRVARDRAFRHGA